MVTVTGWGVDLIHNQFNWVHPPYQDAIVTKIIKKSLLSFTIHYYWVTWSDLFHSKVRWWQTISGKHFIVQSATNWLKKSKIHFRPQWTPMVESRNSLQTSSEEEQNVSPRFCKEPTREPGAPLVPGGFSSSQHCFEDELLVSKIVI